MKLTHEAQGETAHVTGTFPESLLQPVTHVFLPSFPSHVPLQLLPQRAGSHPSVPAGVAGRPYFPQPWLEEITLPKALGSSYPGPDTKISPMQLTE